MLHILGLLCWVVKEMAKHVGVGGTHGTHGIPRYQISRYQYRGGHGIPSMSRYFTVLLSRLSSWFGITGTVLDWFKSSLSSRPFRVKCEGSFSSLHICFCGVSQVSVLGPWIL